MRKSANQIRQPLIRFPVLGREAWHDVAEIALLELRILSYFAGQEAFTQRTEWNQPDPEFLQRRDHLRFRLPPPKRIFTLERSDGLNGVCAANGLHACFRKSEVFHLTFLNQLLHRSGDFFDWNVRIDTVLIEQVDDIGLETLQRSLGDLLDVLRAAIQPSLLASARIKLEPELGGDHHVPAVRSESFAHEFLVRKRAVDFSRIEERNPAFHCCPDDRDHLFRVSGRPVAKTHAHAPEPKSRNFQVAFSKFALLHCFLPRREISSAFKGTASRRPCAVSTRRITARLQRPRTNSDPSRFWGGPDFSRAAKSLKKLWALQRLRCAFRILDDFFRNLFRRAVSAAL